MVRDHTAGIRFSAGCGTILDYMDPYGKTNSLIAAIPRNSVPAQQIRSSVCGAILLKSYRFWRSKGAARGITPLGIGPNGTGNEGLREPLNQASGRAGDRLPRSRRQYFGRNRLSHDENTWTSPSFTNGSVARRIRSPRNHLRSRKPATSRSCFYRRLTSA